MPIANPGNTPSQRAKRTVCAAQHAVPRSYVGGDADTQEVRVASATMAMPRKTVTMTMYRDYVRGKAIGDHMAEYDASVAGSCRPPRTKPWEA